MEHPLRTFRKAAGLSLDQLSDVTKLSKSSLSRIETGAQQPSFDAIRTLVEFSRSHDGMGPLTADDFFKFGQPSVSQSEASAA